jgi:hypothetical protein
MFNSEKNSSKLFAEGAIGNLMNVLHCPENEVKQFWDIVKSNQHSKDDEIFSNHISDGNSCLLSSCCCYLEGDDN